ncbi:Mediator of RNA polymerase II transcription subunit 24 [Frankliniella fusca]|uniref:Mediator of RNA polymerase II transcription subunit 24 n=1 Tax=Frankliniella fusca TaxID=407009 RepID=A0AAE1H0L2_9NEOP|nr:Mediator of RNA polymerase II transcription subunit 24 [Frankliniella fusca]
MRNFLSGTTTVSCKMTSKTSSLKALLLRAWRERWSDLQWGIHIKMILPRGVSGDVHNLADCILQQALVGPGPNQLVLSYLKHTLSSQLVSYAAVLQRISKYEQFYKPHCAVSLLEFLQSIQPGITCRSKPEESMLPGALMRVVHWLLQCLMHVLDSLPSTATDSSTLPHPEMFDLPIKILSNMIDDDFMTAVLYIAKYEDQELYMDVSKKCQEIQGLIKQNTHFIPNPKLNEVLSKLQDMDLDLGSRCLPSFQVVSGLAATKDGCEPLTYCLQPLLAIEVMQNPCADTYTLVSQLRMIQRLKGLSNARLYCELMRACFITINNVLEMPQIPQWGAFTFIKMPQILLQLHTTSKGRLGKGEFSQDVVDALELLLQFTPLLDIIDAKWPSSCIESLLTAILKVGLITDEHCKKYTIMREASNSSSALKSEQSSTITFPNYEFLQQAEGLLEKILRTLDADYVDIPEPLLGVLCQVLDGMKFELILAVASVEGKLRTFVSKLIKFNEGSKQVGGKSAQTRAMLFDITFLMLCLIVQMYGSDVVLSEQGGNSFFEQWARDCMVERKQAKSPDQMLKPQAQTRANELLTQFNSGEADFPISQVKWHEVCWSVPLAIKEVLVAWEHDALTPNDVKRILDTMKARMCCLPICATAWLCSYMQILPQEKLLKPINMVQQFLSNSGAVDSSQEVSTFTERADLMAAVICKMQNDVPIAQPKSKARVLSPTSIVSCQPICEQLTNIWNVLHQRGWMQNEATHQLESLLNSGGANWFVTNVVKEVLQYRYKEDLDRAVDVAFAVFHLDLEHCTLTLILHVLPQYLHNRLMSDELMEPQASALAKLSAYCVFASANLDSVEPFSAPNARKRNRPEDFEDLDLLVPACKLMRLGNCNGDGKQSVPSLAFNEEENVNAIKEPLASALRKLFQTLNILVTRDGEVSQQTHFALRFIQLVVFSGKEHAAAVLHDMPSSLIPSLIRALPENFSTDLIVRLYDIQSITGRKSTIRDLCLLRNLNLKSQISE